MSIGILFNLEWLSVIFILTFLGASSDMLKSPGPVEERERSRSRSTTREHIKSPVYERSKSRRDIETGVCF